MLKKTCLFLSLLSLTVLAFTAAANPTLTAVPRTDWARDLSARLTQTAAQQQDIPVMFLGDSITMLWEYAADHQYPGGKDAWEKYFAPLGAVNYGVSGDRVEHVLWRITEGKQLECKPKVIVLMIGTNNLAAQPPPTTAELAAGIENLLVVIKQQLPATKVLLVGILPRQGQLPVAEVNRQLAVIAPKHDAEFFDFRENLLLGQPQVIQAVFRDGLHLSPAGYEVLAQALRLPVARSLGLAPAERGRRDQLVGLVYETEEWSEPKDGWQINKSSADRWTLWSTEEAGWSKRSWGQTLRTPVNSKVDRATPEEGAPPLHTKLTGIPVGNYLVYVSGPLRNIALSLDGKTWNRYSGGEINLGFWRIDQGFFELWVDDLYATHANPGPAYYDYIRLVPADEPKIYGMKAFTRQDGKVQISWLTTTPTPAAEFSFNQQGMNETKTVQEESANLRNHAVLLGGLTAGQKYQGQVSCRLSANMTMKSEVLTFVVGSGTPTMTTKKQQVALRVHEPVQARQDWPVTSGVPFAQGTLASADDVRILNADGQPVPMQAEVMATWPDNSVKWLTVDFLANTKSGGEVVYTLETGAGLGSQIVSDKPWDSKATKPLPEKSRLELADGKVLTATAHAGAGVPTVRGGRKITWVSTGEYAGAQPDDAKLFSWRSEQTVFAGRHQLRRHRWYLLNTHLSEMYQLVKNLSWQPAAWQTNKPQLSNGQGGTNLTLRQNWSQRAELVLDGQSSFFERGDGFLRLDKDKSWWVRDFWQTWPKGLTVANGQPEVDILPTLPADYPGKDFETLNHLMEHFYWYRDGAYMYRRSMENMTEVWTCEAEAPADGKDALLAQWLANPLFAAASPEYYCATEAFGAIAPSKPGQFPAYEKALDKSFANMENGRKQRQEYGWMNFGDWYGERRWNWGNNEYDLTYVCAVNFARLGRLDFLKRGEEMARHYTTTDYIALTNNEGQRELMYEHCVGHTGGFLSKNDPRFADVNMTGFVQPLIDNSGGHSFQPGNFYYACLLGERRFWEVAENVCRMQARNYTPNFVISIERSAGWALTNAMNAYIFTHDPYFLNAARIYVSKIKEMQNPETGCLDLRQDQSECDCPDKAQHRGGKAFATGVMLHGLSLYHQLGDEPELAKQLITRCVDWLLDYSWDDENKGFRYKTGCPKYARGRGYPMIVSEGIAYAGKITKNPRYVEFLQQNAGHTLARETNGSGYSAGKGFSSPNRQVPHLLRLLLEQGVSDLEDRKQPTVNELPRVLLDREGRGTLLYDFWNQRGNAMECALRVTNAPGLQVEPAEVKWQAPSGRAAAPAMQLRLTDLKATGQVMTFQLRAGTTTSEVKIMAVPPAPLPKIGKRFGFVGGEKHFTLAALRHAGGNPELISNVNTAQFDDFGCLMIGGDSLGVSTPMLSVAGAQKLRAFVEAGGKLLFWQINDSYWMPDVMGARLEVVEPDGKAGKILVPNHPLLDGVKSLEGTICYDSITIADKPWQVLVQDQAGKPSVLNMKIGKGEVVVFNPSVDREFHPQGNKDIGIELETCRKILENSLRWAK